MKSTNRNKKVLVLGLPKSGTSTLATMLRILDYQVTGPNPYIKGSGSLQETCDTYEAFYDYHTNYYTEVISFLRINEKLKKQLHTLQGKSYFKLTSFIYKNK